MADTTVCSSESPAKSTDHKASLRKSNKPLMEKKRRARINSCLGQLKSLVLQALKKDTSQFSKLEKADILEMTVKHLKSVQQQHMSVAMATDPNVLTKYRAGFNECAGEVMRYLGSVNGLTDDTRTRVLNHLAMCMQSVNTAASVTLANQAAAVANQNSLAGHVGGCAIPASLFPAFSSPPPPPPQPPTVHVPPAGASLAMAPDGVALPALGGSRVGQVAGDTKPQTSCPSSLQLIPGTLPSGQLAFFVASPATLQTPIQAIPVYTAPSSGSPTPVSSPDVSPRGGALPDVNSPPVKPHPRLMPSSDSSDISRRVSDNTGSAHQARLTPCEPPVRVRPSSPRTCPANQFRGSPHPRETPQQSTHEDSDSDVDPLRELPDEEEEKVWRPW